MFKKILITGAYGFLGHHIVPALKQAFPAAELIAVGRKDYDLLEPGTPARMFRDIRPDCVVHLAAKSGGIITNKKHPADFFYDNVVINTHVFEASFRAGVRKFLTFMGGCSYPANAVSPIGEDQMWNGFPQAESAGYSVAKKMILVQSDVYRRQHGFNSVVLIPGNVYGEFDNFNQEDSHVIPGMIRRFVEAKEQSSPSVACYGSGRPTRDFVYAGDVAKLIPWFVLNYNSSDPVNISSGTRTFVRELAASIRAIVGYQGDIAWDTSKPDGQMDKIFDVSKLRQLGLSCDTPLEEGIRKTVEWFRKAGTTGDVRL